MWLNSDLAKHRSSLPDAPGQRTAEYGDQQVSRDVGSNSGAVLMLCLGFKIACNIVRFTIACQVGALSNLVLTCYGFGRRLLRHGTVTDINPIPGFSFAGAFPFNFSVRRVF